MVSGLTKYNRNPFMGGCGRAVIYAKLMLGAILLFYLQSGCCFSW